VTRVVALVALVALVVVLASGCAGRELRHRALVVDQVVARARARAAQRCAPVELAMAEAHLDFAGVELDEGDYFRAREELDVAGANARVALARSAPDRCVAGARALDRDGDGVRDEVDRCVDRAEDRDRFEDADGCPDLDDDRDGLADAVDACPREAEDRDGFADTDGCPEQDNDLDKLADRVDQCPDAAEDLDGNADDDGCPDCDDDGDGVPECPRAVDRCPGVAAATADGCPPYKDVVVTADRLVIKQAIYFESGRAIIRRVSFEILDVVAKVLRENPTMTVRIEGHTDSQGDDRRNLALSRRRADAVRRYLVAAGIEGSRMVAEGYGETQPIADNRTGDGRVQNRRVEFVITGR
jgi:outer membrane protein OmpA-like peptidoglycan-associated protein